MKRGRWNSCGGGEGHHRVHGLSMAHGGDGVVDVGERGAVRDHASRVKASAAHGAEVTRDVFGRAAGPAFGAGEHLAEMQAEDPLPKLRKVMLDHQFTEDELDKIVADIDAEIDDAVEHALAADLPDTDEIYKDVLEEVA